MMIHQRFHLRRPVGQVLHLVQKDVDRLAPLRPLVEAALQHARLEPAAQRQNRLLKPLQRWEFVELHPEQPLRGDAFAEQMLDNLQL
jgi:hypothetical protein